MAPLVSTIEIERRPEEVFTVASNPLRFYEWQPDVVNVRMLGDTRFATTRRIGGAKRTMIQQITRNDPPRGWAAYGIDGPIRPHATITMEPVNEGTWSRVTFTLDFQGHGIGIALLRLVRRQAQTAAPISYRNLKQLLERDQ